MKLLDEIERLVIFEMELHANFLKYVHILQNNAFVKRKRIKLFY